jgi:hypothetical protein
MMTLMLKVFAAVLLTLPIASAQITPIFVDFPPQLKSFLELTDDQVTAIKKANTDLNEFRSTKLQRQFQVQMELAQETAKQTPDPMAMGLRYVELEAIRRELQAEQQKTATAVQNLLTAPQKTKVAALQQAFQLYPTACSAIDQNVLQPPALLSGRNMFPGNIIPANRIYPPTTQIASFLLGLPGINFSACSGATGVIRNGEFTFNQAPTLE